MAPDQRGARSYVGRPLPIVYDLFKGARDACYDGGNTFWLKRFMNDDRVPEPKTTIIVHSGVALLFVVCPSHGVLHRVPLSPSSKSRFVVSGIEFLKLPPLYAS